MPIYKHIESNEYTHHKKKIVVYEQTSHCLCHRVRGIIDYCTGNCINRSIKIECDNSNCLCLQYCQNRPFSKGTRSGLEIVETDVRGMGLVTKETIQQGEFITEYIGEVYDTTSPYGAKRLGTNLGRQLLYMMELQDRLVIDASRKGNLSRFINHSCEPNCRVQNWIVGGQQRVGIFSLRRIEQGEQLSYNYGPNFWKQAKFPCLCGAQRCIFESPQIKTTFSLHIEVELGHLLFLDRNRSFYVTQPLRCQILYEQTSLQDYTSDIRKLILVEIRGPEEEVFTVYAVFSRLKCIQYQTLLVDPTNSLTVKAFLQSCEVVYVCNHNEAMEQLTKFVLIGLSSVLKRVWLAVRNNSSKDTLVEQNTRQPTYQQADCLQTGHIHICEQSTNSLGSGQTIEQSNLDGQPLQSQT